MQQCEQCFETSCLKVLRWGFFPTVRMRKNYLHEGEFATDLKINPLRMCAGNTENTPLE